MSSSFQARNAVTLLKKQLDDATVQSSSGWMHIWCTPSFCIIASRECQHFGRECRFLCWDMLGPFCTFCKCLARRWSKLFIACRLPQAARDRERPLNNATVIYSAITYCRYCLHAFTSRLNPFMGRAKRGLQFSTRNLGVSNSWSWTKLQNWNSKPFNAVASLV